MSTRTSFKIPFGMKGICLSTLLILMTTGLNAGSLKLSFTEIAGSADLIFVGTVENLESRFNDQQNLIITEVLFSDIAIIHSTTESKQSRSSFITMQYVGGCVGDLCLDSSISPFFQPDHRYLLFISDDEKTYINPLIGGSQGLFEVVADVQSGEEYILTTGKKCIYGADKSSLKKSRSAVAYFRGGSPVFIEEPTGPFAKPPLPPPVPAHPLDSASLPSAELGREEQSLALHPFSLVDFTDYIKRVASETDMEERILRREGLGTFVSQQGGGSEGEKQYSPSFGPSTESAGEAAEASSLDSPQGGTIGYCGYHTLPFIMETVPSDWWSYDTIESARQSWNWFMAVYQKASSDGKYGHNSKNEFCGWVKDADMFRIYGVHWNGYVAWAHHWWRLGSPCGRLLESDILFNPAYDWTDNEESAWGNSNVILLRPLVMHELAHTWGMQRGEAGQWGYPETYDYDQLTVVHSYYHDVIEDGRGIHVADAYCFRRDYQSRTNIKDIVDVAVESYYADNGLHNATANKSSYYTGDQISINNITVENNSYDDVSDVRIRIYLSKDRTINTNDYKIGSYWHWETFDAESRSVFDISSTIPNDVPAGTYYIGIIITVNGYEQDDYTHNNRTSLFATVTIQIKSGNGNSGGSTSSKCFIATAAFGSPFHPYVKILRNFRDQCLLPFEPGRRLVDTYYRLSPPLARLVARNDALKAAVRGGLLPLAAVCHTLLSLGSGF